MKLFLKIALVIFFSTSVFSQNGVLTVTLTDSATKEKLPFASVLVLRNGLTVSAGTTDLDGNVWLKNISPGSYNVKTSYMGYKPAHLIGVNIAEGKSTYLEIQMKTSPIMLAEFEVVSYREPLIDPDIPTKKKQWWKFFKRKRELRKMRKSISDL